MENEVSVNQLAEFAEIIINLFCSFFGFHGRNKVKHNSINFLPFWHFLNFIETYHQGSMGRQFKRPINLNPVRDFHIFVDLVPSELFCTGPTGLGSWIPAFHHIWEFFSHWVFSIDRK